MRAAVKIRIALPSYAIVLIALVSALTGCGSPARPNASAPAQQNIYVTNACNGTVTVYPVGSSGNVAPLVPNPALCGPSSIAVEKTNGDLYVVNSENGTITAYAKGSNGSVAPKISLSDDTLQGLRIALDTSGRLYAYVSPASKGIIQIYASGANGDAQPIASIIGSNTGLDYISALAVDPEGTILCGGQQ